MQFTLSDSLPPPDARAPRGKVVYPFDKLTAAGQSLTVLAADVDANRFTAAAHSYARNHGWVATVRTLPDGRICVWRLHDLAVNPSEVRAERAAAQQEMRAQCAIVRDQIRGLKVEQAKDKPLSKAAQARADREHKARLKMETDVGQWLIRCKAPQSLAALAASLNLSIDDAATALDAWRDRGVIIDSPQGATWKSPQSKPVTP
jgi:leucyl aminopeptidase (aminopeptidase T)